MVFDCIDSRSLQPFLLCIIINLMRKYENTELYTTISFLMAFVKPGVPTKNSLIIL